MFWGRKKIEEEKAKLNEQDAGCDRYRALTEDDAVYKEGDGDGALNISWLVKVWYTENST